MRIIAVFILTFFSVIYTNLRAQNIDLKTIMGGEVFTGAWPKDVQYNAFGDTVFFYRKNELDTLPQWFALAGGQEVRIQDDYKARFGQRIPHPVNSNIFLWKQSNAIYKGNLKAKSLDPIVVSHQTIKNLRWIGVTQDFVFTQGENIIRYNNGSFLTIGVFTKEQNDTQNKEQKWLENQQSMFDVLTLRKQREEANNNSKESKSPFPKIKTAYSGSLSNIQVANDYSTFWFTTSEREDEHTEYMDYVTHSGFSEAQKARSKVGMTEVRQQLLHYSCKTDSIIKIDLKTLPGIYTPPEFLKSGKDSLDQPKSVYILGPVLNPYNNWGLVTIKSNDNKDRWIILVHPEKDWVLVDHQHDDTWIGGPGITGWNMVQGNVGWFDKGDKVYYQSEKTGYSHLYGYDLTSQQKSALTQGDFEIHNVRLSPSGAVFYLTANKIHAGVRNFYHLKWKNKQLQPILEGKGNYEVLVAPDEKTITGRYSDWVSPWEVFQAKNVPHTEAKLVTNSISAAYKEANFKTPELIHFEAKDGAGVPARLYRPENSNGAGIIFVHGAGYLQNAHYWWSGYFREFMFHQLLRDKGYTVIDIDYRASKGYGRDWRTAIYRHMGGNDLSDQLDGRQYLIDSLNIDPERVGIYGGSYGGFITLMALLTEPGKFKCGAALRSVTDWAHYNHPYTSNILNTPVEDSLAYYRSSPINFAENLEDRLLMLHGVLDNNVQYQDILRLTQRFIELGKENWELASFPLEAHGFKHPTSWFDEYRRILKLFEEELR